MTLVANWRNYLDDAVEASYGVKKGKFSNVTSYSETVTSFYYGSDKNGKTLKLYAEGGYNGPVSTYYGYDNSGKAYGYEVVENTGAITNKTGVTTTHFGGVSHSLFNITTYGPTALLQQLETVYNLDSNQANYVAGNTMHIEHAVNSYGSINLNFIDVTLNFDGEFLTDFTVTYKTYYEYQLVQDIELGTWSVSPENTYEPSATSYVYELSYIERPFSAPYAYEDFFFTSYDLAVKGTTTAIGDTIEVQSGVQTQLSIINAAPASANAAIDMPTVTLGTGVTASQLSANYNSYSAALNITARQVGTFTITIKTKNTEKTLTIVAKPAAPTGIANPKVYTTLAGTVKSSTQTTAIEFYAGSYTHITAAVNPTGAIQTINVTATGDNASNLTVTADTIKQNGTDLAAYKLSSSVAGEYTISVSSTENAEIAKTFTVTVKEAPAAAELFANRYVQVTTVLACDITFTPSAEDATKGTATVYENYEGLADTGTTETVDYSYNAATGVVTFSKEGTPCDYSLVFDNNFNAYYHEGGSYASLKVFSPGAMLNGSSFITYDFNERWGTIIDFRNDKVYWDEYLYNLVPEYVENEDGTWNMNFEAETLTAMAQALGLDSIESYVINADFTEITMHYTLGGEAKTAIYK